MFKVGSKVKCVGPSRCLRSGNIYTVKHVKREGGECFVLLSDADGAYYFCNRFVQVNAFKGNIK